MTGLCNRCSGRARVRLSCAGKKTELQEVSAVERKLRHALRPDHVAEVVGFSFEKIGQAMRFYGDALRGRCLAHVCILSCALANPYIELRDGVVSKSLLCELQ